MIVRRSKPSFFVVFSIVAQALGRDDVLRRVALTFLNDRIIDFRHESILHFFYHGHLELVIRIKLYAQVLLNSLDCLDAFDA